MNSTPFASIEAFVGYSVLIDTLTVEAFAATVEAWLDANFAEQGICFKG